MRPWFSWMIRMPGNVPAAFGFARYAMISEAGPGNFTSGTSMLGLVAATPGVVATAGVANGVAVGAEVAVAIVLVGAAVARAFSVSAVPQPSVVSANAVIGTLPVMSSTRRIMSRRLMCCSLYSSANS